MANWNALMQAPDAGRSFMDSFNQSRDRRDQRELQGMQMQEHQEDRQFQRDGREAEQRKAQLAEAREKLTMTVKLMEGASPEDWGQRLQAAQQMGLDTANVPPQFDQQWLQQSSHQARVLIGKIDEELVVIDGVAFGKQSGQPKFESPYNRVISGPGGIYEQPRIGIGRGGQGQAPQGRVVDGGGLPQGWVIEEDGGPSPDGSGGFLTGEWPYE